MPAAKLALSLTPESETRANIRLQDVPHCFHTMLSFLLIHLSCSFCLVLSLSLSLVVAAKLTPSLISGTETQANIRLRGVLHHFHAGLSCYHVISVLLWWLQN